MKAIGSHGAEHDGHAGLILTGTQRELRAELVRAAMAIVREAPGVRWELKPGSVAVHVRRADPAVGRAALAAVRTGPATWPGVHVQTGRDVIELSVVPMSKGDALRRLIERHEIGATLFVGDDATDEAAFAVLGPSDLGIKVGPERTVASHRVTDTDEVAAALAALAVARSLHFNE